MRVDSSGRLGLGTSSPGSRLTVNRVNFADASATGSTTLSNAGITVEAATDTNNRLMFGIGSTGGAPWIQAQNTSSNATQSLILNPVGGNVGIGTSSPDTLLHVSSATGSASPTPTEVRIATTTSAGDWSSTLPWGSLSFYSADATGGARVHASINTIANGVGGGTSSLTFNTADSGVAAVERMRINATGQVGIGTTSPSSPLHVYGGTIRAESTSSSTPGLTLVGAGPDQGWVKFGTTSGDYYSVKAGADYQGMLFIANGSERARIDSSGRLLVGTSSTSGNITANDKLAVVITGDNTQGGISVTDYAGTGSTTGSNACLRLQRSIGTTDGSFTALTASAWGLGRIEFNGSNGSGFGTGATIEGIADSAAWGSSDHPARLVFSTTADGASSPSERMRIGQSGFTKISNSGTYNDAAGQYHEIMTNVTSNHALLVRAPASYASANIKSFVLTAAGSGYNHFVADANGTTVCVIRGDGNLLNTNNSYTGLSDSKLKENIVDANSQWNDLKALQVRNYNFREKTGQQTHTQIGLIAQEVELISPGLVIESPDRDADGNDLGTTTKAVQYSVLYMKAVKALQEAMERIEALEAKVAALEGA